MKLFEEDILEPIVRHFRFKEGVKHIPKRKPIIMADLGSGPKIRFYHFAKKYGVNVKKYFGIDPLLDKKVLKSFEKNKEIQLVKAPLQRKIPLKDNSVNIVVGFAFLEHIDSPGAILNDAVRVLKKGGIAVFTTPSYYAQFVLEFMAFKLHLVSKREIAEHKNYFNNLSLAALVKKELKKKIQYRHKYFELGMNNLVLIKKLK